MAGNRSGRRVAGRGTGSGGDVPSRRGGYVLDRINGSHHVFHKTGQRPIVIPVHHGKVKPYYVRQIRKIIETN